MSRVPFCFRKFTGKYDNVCADKKVGNSTFSRWGQILNSILSGNSIDSSYQTAAAEALALCNVVNLLLLVTLYHINRVDYCTVCSSWNIRGKLVVAPLIFL